MTTPRARHPRCSVTWRFAAALLLGCAGALPVQADPKPAAVAEQGPTWASLKPAQREALKPLERDWAGIDTLRKRKWLEIAERYPTLPPADQARLQARMTEWTRLSPQERSQARLQFQEAKQVPVQDRQASWEAYQALPPEQRQELARRAVPATSAASSAAAARPSARALAAQGPQPKSNTVPAPTSISPPKPVTPLVVQAQPGATTTLISKPPAPPAHQPTGQPKIAATPEYVDKKTLLPQAGAQSTAVIRPASAP